MNNYNFISFEYEKHPAFSTSKSPYRVSKSKIETFDELYRDFFQDVNKNKKFHDKEQSLKDLLVDIFKEMKAQAIDEHEIYFLKELETKTKDLLNKEISFYKWISKQGFNQNHNTKLYKELKNNRYFFGILSDEAISQIIEISNDSINMLRDRVAKLKFTRDDLSINKGIIVSKISNILNNEFSKNGVLDAVCDYMGGRYFVSGLALELSVPDATWWHNSLDGISQPKTMYAHLDESIKHPKAIVYLSKVSLQNGPTSCYPGIYERLKLNAMQELIGRIIGSIGNDNNSKLKGYYDKKYHQAMSSERFRSHFMRLPSELRFNSHFGWDVLPNNEMEAILIDCQKTMIGNNGTFIVFDGARLLHRGGLIESGERIALQVIFSPAPNIIKKIIRMFRVKYNQFLSKSL